MSRHTHLFRVGLAAFALACALVLSWTHTSQADPASPEPTSTTSAGQSVTITLTGTGTPHAATNADGDALDLDETVAALPVRILTTFTPSGGGSQSAAPGPSTAAISIQNTTGRAQRITADTDGRQSARSAIVSTPVSVAASVKLPGVAPSQILTGADAASSAPLTNGLIGIDSEGVTTVHWAAVTGIGPAGPNARFTLAVDAPGFTMPAFEVAAQEGFSLSPNAADRERESELASSAMAAVSQANSVVQESSEALGRTRQALADTGGQIASTTVSDLQASNTRLESSAQSVTAALTDLDTRIAALYDETGSKLAAQLTATTAAVRTMLGDPSAPAPVVSVDQGSCSLVRPAVPGSAGAGGGSAQSGQAPQSGAQGAAAEDPSVYGVVNSLAAVLDGLASASDSCRARLSTSIDALLGPSQPSERTCPAGAASVACTVWRGQAAMEQRLDDIFRQVRSFADVVQSGAPGNAVNATVGLGNDLERVRSLVSALALTTGSSGGDAGGSPDATLDALAGSITAAQSTVSGLGSTISQVNASSVQAVQAIDAQSPKLEYVRMRVCIAAGRTIPNGADRPGPATLDQATADAIMGELAERDCPEREGGTGTVRPGGNFSAQGLGFQSRANAQAAVDATADTAGGGSPALRSALDQLGGQLSALSSAVASAKEARGAGTPVGQLVGQVGDATQQVLQGYQSLRGDILTLANQLDTLGSDMGSFLTRAAAQTGSAADEAAAQTSSALDAAQSGINQAADQVFQQASSQLGASAQQLRERAGQSIAQTGAGVEAANQSGAQALAQQTQEGKEGAHSAAANLASDSDTASRLISSDIAKLMSDIGSADGGGMLGALATAQAQLGTEDAKTAQSSAQLFAARARGSAAREAAGLDEAAVRESLARLESSSGQGTAGAAWYSFHIDPSTAEDEGR